MRNSTTVLSTLGAALMAAGIMQAQAAEPYYDPSNVASSTGKTVGYELYKTIGCPGKGILDVPCKVSAPTPPAEPKPVAKPAPVVVPTAPVDSDGDGVVDSQDKCPNTPAGRKVNAAGCELDSDGDGVVDGLDKCPNTPAGRKVNADGCEMDSDGDGVTDALDQCPNTPAGDRVDDKGCSLLPAGFSLKGVNFDNDSATLRPEAAAILDEAVAALHRYPSLKLAIGGHTDSVDTDTYNQGLSERRAQAVLDYLVSRNVAAGRLSAKGYGESEPIANNATAEGRAQNRRAELRVAN